MALVSLTELRLRVRERADMVSSTFVSDAELTRYINASLQELYDLLVQAIEDYNITTVAFTISSGSTYSLPSDFYKLRGLEESSEGEWRALRPFNWNERSSYDSVIINRYWTYPRYRIVGSNIEFLPSAEAPGSYRIRYVPLLVPLSSDSDTFNGHNGWEEYAVVCAAIKCKDKEESSTTVLERERERLEKRLQTLIDNRDQQEASRVGDVRCFYETGARW